MENFNFLNNIFTFTVAYFLLIFIGSCTDTYVGDINSEYASAAEEHITSECSDLRIKIPDCFGEKSILNISLSKKAEWYCEGLGIYFSVDALENEVLKDEIDKTLSLSSVLEHYTSIRRKNMFSFAVAKNKEEKQRNGNKSVTVYIKGKTDSWSEEALIYLHIIQREECFYCLQYIFPSSYASIYDSAIQENINSIKI